MGRRIWKLTATAGVCAALAVIGAAAFANAQDGAPAQPRVSPTGVPIPQNTPPGLPVPEGAAVKSETLEGGLLVEDLKIGTGYEVKPGGAVVALYHGTLKSDPEKVFDSAYRRGSPIMFSLNGVIEGWQKGVPGMKVGGVRRLTIPAAMAYGEDGAPPMIPPNSDLVFIVEIVDALQVEDIKVGEGETATGQCVAVVAHTFKDAEGKELHKADAAKPYIWLPGEMSGMSMAIEGMKVGGKRKVVIPKEMNFIHPNAGNPLPSEVALTAEIELLHVRNLAPPPQR